MGKITSLEKEKTFPVSGELAKRMNLLIEEYVGILSTVEVIGVLELAKTGVIDTAKINID